MGIKLSIFNNMHYKNDKYKSTIAQEMNSIDKVSVNKRCNPLNKYDGYKFIWILI